MLELMLRKKTLIHISKGIVTEFDTDREIKG
jgi:hypothetical protein